MARFQFLQMNLCTYHTCLQQKKVHFVKVIIVSDKIHWLWIWNDYALGNALRNAALFADKWDQVTFENKNMPLRKKITHVSQYLFTYGIWQLPSYSLTATCTNSLSRKCKGQFTGMTMDLTLHHVKWLARILSQIFLVIGYKGAMQRTQG